MEGVSVLILGGTAPARALAKLCVAEGLATTSSLAGRVSHPKLPEGDVRIGGFGGVEGLSGWLRQHRIHAVVDATHPFAEQISRNAVAACAEVGLPIASLVRPSWHDLEGSERWHWVADHAAAASKAAEIAQRPFLTVGRQRLKAFESLADRFCLVRVVEPPSGPLPESWELLLSRGPYEFEDELELLAGHAIDCLVTKDSGGEMTVAKIHAADQLGVPIVIVERAQPETSGPQFDNPEDALEWLKSQSPTEG